MILETLINLPLVLPPTVVGYYLLIVLGRDGPLVRLFDLNVLFTWQGATVASIVVAIPLMVQSAKAAIESIDPALENAARTLGSTELEVIWRVTLPLARRFGLRSGELRNERLRQRLVVPVDDDLPDSFRKRLSGGRERRIGDADVRRQLAGRDVHERDVLLIDREEPREVGAVGGALGLVLALLAVLALVVVVGYAGFSVMAVAYSDGHTNLLEVVQQRLEPIVYGEGMRGTNRDYTYEYFDEHPPQDFPNYEPGSWGPAEADALRRTAALGASAAELMIR